MFSFVILVQIDPENSVETTAINKNETNIKNLTIIITNKHEKITMRGKEKKNVEGIVIMKG